jgi:hypothetical protein
VSPGGAKPTASSRSRSVWPGRPVSPTPAWAALVSELKRPVVNLLILWDEYRAVHPNGYSATVSDADRRGDTALTVAGDVLQAQKHPTDPHALLDVARDWAARFVHWYNHEHRHSGIGYVTPSQRPAGHDKALLMARHDLYQQARRSNPRRWSGQTRDWPPVAAVTLNPERDAIIRTTLSRNPLSGSIGAGRERARGRHWKTVNEERASLSSPPGVICENDCVRSWCVCGQPRYVLEPRSRAAWLLHVRQQRGDARPDDDDAQPRGGERPPGGDARQPDVSVTVPFLVFPPGR